MWIKGEGAVVNGTIFIDGMGMGTANDQGRFRVEADDFGSASRLVTVGDGVSSVGASLDGCTPTAPPPDVDQVTLVLTSTGVIPGASGQADLALDFVADLGAASGPGSTVRTASTLTRFRTPEHPRPHFQSRVHQ